MAFFSEIKARLGLDITPFEKGLSQAQGSLGKVVDGAAGKLGNLKNVGTTLATAVGFNLQSIAEGLARMVVGFSKAQEAALLELVESSKAAADDLAKIASKRQGNDDPVTRIKNLDREAESLRQQVTSRTKLTTSEKLGIINQEGIIAGIGKIITEENSMEKAKAAAQKRLGEISREQLKANDEIKEAAAKKEKEDAKEIDTAAKATAKVREDALNETLSLEEKILAAKDKVNESEQAAYESKAGVESAEAEFILTQDRANLAKLEREKTKKQTDAEKQQQEELDSDEKDFIAERTAAEKKRTNELDAQLKKLKDQKTTIEQTLAAQAKSAKASVEDIASGKRQVGGTTKANAQKLLAARSEEQRRIDAVSQAEDTLANGGKGLTGAAQKDTQAELDRRKAALAATQSRKSNLEGALKDKTSETFAAEQVAELKKVVAEIIKTNQALAPASITSNT